MNQSERSSGKIRYQVGGKMYKIPDRVGKKVKPPTVIGVPDTLDEIILS